MAMVQKYDSYIEVNVGNDPIVYGLTFELKPEQKAEASIMA